MGKSTEIYYSHTQITDILLHAIWEVTTWQELISCFDWQMVLMVG